MSLLILHQKINFYRKTMRKFEDDNQLIIQEKGYFYIIYKCNELTLETAIINYENRIEFFKEKKVDNLLVDISNIKFITRAARYFLSESSYMSSLNKSSIAFYSNNEFSQFIFSFIIKVNNKNSAMKYHFFDSIENAKKWLRIKKY